ANRLVLEDLESSIEGELIESQLHGRVVVGKGSRLIRCTVRGPAVIGQNCALEECYIGPFTSIGDGVQLRACEVEYSIILDGSRVDGIEPRIEHSLLGKNVVVSGKARRPRALRLMLGDSSSVELP
ncbi:MAG: hypothetical protein NZL85_07045, partial [Fimbriimonadales bacterium]|nr:hypothetical protein [Fimbriimonadales bacterium]